ncbi:MAG TPA: glycine--tRNA ligase subunit beta [Stellaceae bacterium]|nr:glycine--tRNA ligase subunit beta [Stellaceae bacterium]
MPDLLLELLTEEIPARMQGLAARELKRLVEIELKEMNLAATSVETFVTPRRLTLAVAGLPKMQAGSVEERRGPRVGAPDQAVQGFLKSAGLNSLDQCEKRTTDKGEFWFATIKRPGRATKDVLSVLLLEVIRDLPWPKSMRFPAASFRWVRPLASALCLFDGKVLKLDLGAVPVGNKTVGHRFLSPAAFAVRDLKDYRAKLARAKVVLDAAERRQRIETGLAQAATKAGLKIQHDESLLEEVTGLVEWPTVLMGAIDPSFMDLPPEVLTTAMRAHQKYFATLDKAGKLAPRFLLVANLDAADGGKAIVAGNERVLKARLADARFFWDQDRKVKLIARVEKLRERVFHAKLGTVQDKMTRVAKLAETVAPHVPGADVAKLRRAAALAKADLSSGMVGEFPELQGVIGRYYAQHDGEPAEVAAAIAEHYAPQGPSDRCPTAPVSVALALADKLDTLANFFAIGEKPTGSGDPFALRRAALGVIRLILENKLRLPLLTVFKAAAPVGKDSGKELLDFFADRLKVHLRERGVRHDLIASVFALGDEDDLVRLLARVDALGAFLKTEDGANLLVAYRRAANILRIEEKKDGRSYSGVPRPDLLQAAEERTLDKALHEAALRGAAALEVEDFAATMRALAALRGPVDKFFDKVTVNTDDRELRENRLRLLSQIRDTLNRVADFAQIEG